VIESRLPLELPPGLFRNGTRYQAKGRWYDANLVRFYEKAIRPVQGWRVASDANGLPLAALVGVPRTALAWRSATGIPLLAVGTSLKLYIVKAGVVYDITPADFAGSGADAFIGVKATGLLTSDTVVPTAGETVTVGSVTYTFRAAPTTIANEVKVTTTAAGALANLQSAINRTGVPGTDYGSLTVVNPTVAAKTLTATTLLMEARTAGTGGNSLATTETSAHLSFAAATLLGGSGGNGDYNSGLYGSDLYGIGKDIIAVNLIDSDTWQLDAFGDVLVATNTNGGAIYNWTGDTAAKAILTTNAPATNRGVVITPERYVTALGSENDVRKVYWAKQATLTTWDRTDVAFDAAGDFTLPTNGRIMCGRRTKAQTLIWTDSDMYSMNFVGSDIGFTFKQEGDNCGIVSPQAAAVVDTAAFWMGRDNFFSYDGFVKPVPCSVHDYVFGDFNTQQASKIFATPISEFGEIWWFYPSGGATEPDRYVVYNYRESHWTTGKLARTAALDRGAMPNPVMFNSLGTIFTHEVAAGQKTVPLATRISDSLLSAGAYLVDPMTDANGTAMTAHTAPGVAWELTLGSAPMDIQSNRAEEGSAGAAGTLMISTGRVSADYEVGATFRNKDAVNVGVNVIYLKLRGNKTDHVCYAMSVNYGATYTLQGGKMDAAGTFTALSGAAINTGIDPRTTPMPCSFRVTGTLLEMLVSGLVVDSFTDGTISAAGFVGLRDATGGSTLGRQAQIDDFYVSDVTTLVNHTPDSPTAFSWVKTTGGALVLVANGLAAADTTEGVHVANVNLGATDYEVSAVLPASTPSAAGVGARMAGGTAKTGYFFGITPNGTSFRIYGKDAAGTALFADVTTPIPSNLLGTNIVATIRVNGTTITGFANGIQMLQKTDATLASGLAGLHVLPVSAGAKVVTGVFIVKASADATTNNTNGDTAASGTTGEEILVPFLESGPVEIGQGDNVMRVQQIIPDEKTLGDVAMRFFSALNPTDTEVERGPYTLTAPTGVRFTARQVRMRVEEVRATDWRVGTVRLGVILGGRR
jgi:hypothetical protein